MLLPMAVAVDRPKSDCLCWSSFLVVAVVADWGRHCYCCRCRSSKAAVLAAAGVRIGAGQDGEVVAAVVVVVAEDDALHLWAAVACTGIVIGLEQGADAVEVNDSAGSAELHHQH